MAVVVLDGSKRPAQPVDDQIGHQAQQPGRQHRRTLVAGVRQLRADQDQRDRGDHHRHLTQPADAGERDLNPLEPLDVSVVNDEIQEQHQQEDPAEGGDLRVGRDDQLFVAGRAVGKFQRAVRRRMQRQLRSRDRVEARGRPHDEQREHQPHAEHRDRGSRPSGTSAARTRLIRFSTAALMMALSNDNDTSRTARHQQR